MTNNSATIPDPSYLKWPINASPEYVKARQALFEEEYALMKHIENVAAQRRALSSGPLLPTYIFEEGDRDLGSDSAPHKVTLAEIASQGEIPHKTLVVYHMMMGEKEMTACSACSMFVDGLNGVAKHLAQHFNLVIIAKAPIRVIRAYAKKRGWNDLRFLSSFDNTFNKDMGVENPDWIQNMPQGPGMSVFIYEEGEEGKEVGKGSVRFWYQTSPHFGWNDGPVVRGMDLLTPVWNMLDITPGGRGDWNPGLDYVQKWDQVTF